jgi:anaerobic ribonucleoside-triphosphate reductase activating protein
MTAIEIAGIAEHTEAEGPGLRFAVWVQGCSIMCPGCCNPQMFSPGRGRTIAVAELAAAIAQAQARHAIEGITVLGGEPLEQMHAVAELCASAVARSLGVIVFSGYTFAQALALPGWDRLWPVVDTLVDGRFDAAQRSTDRRVIGSRNQMLVHRTTRYAAVAEWAGSGSGRPTAEIVLTPGEHARFVGSPTLVHTLRRATNVPRS